MPYSTVVACDWLTGRNLFPTTAVYLCVCWVFPSLCVKCLPTDFKQKFRQPRSPFGPVEKKGSFMSYSV